MALLPESYRLAREWRECALNLVFPWPVSNEAEPVPITAPFCAQCGEPFPSLEICSADFLCTHCVERRWHFQWARAGYRTQGQILEAVVGFKYRDEYFRHRQLVGWLTETFDRYAADMAWDALVPVPLYHLRHRDRGFNQAHELARGLSRNRKWPVLNCLYRYRETASQAGLDRAERWDNMKGAFRLKAGFDVQAKNLLLIDDVFTTGATANACAHALADAGAARLAVLTVARS